MRKLAMLFSLLASSAQASPPSQVTKVGMGAGPRFERDVNASTYNRIDVTTAFVGYTWSQWSFLGEFTHFESLTSISFIEVKRRHFEVMPWGRYSSRQFETWSPYVSAGIGLSWEKVATKLNHSTQQAMGRAQRLWGAAVGAELHAFEDVLSEVEVRLLDAANRDAEISILVRLGVMI